MVIISFHPRSTGENAGKDAGSPKLRWIQTACMWTKGKGNQGFNDGVSPSKQLDDFEAGRGLTVDPNCRLAKYLFIKKK